ncbi:MAG: glycosyltransferase [Syntrophales bacterium]
MRICILGNAASVHIVKWANGLIRLGHKVWVISADPISIHKFDSEVIVEVLPFRPLAGYYLNRYRAKKLINKIDPDILNTHYASGYGTLSRLIGFQPTLLSVWGSDVFDVPYQSRFLNKLVRKNLNDATRIASTSTIMKIEVEKLFKPRENIFVTPFGVDLQKFRPETKRADKFITIGIVKTIAEKYGQAYLVKAIKIVLDRLCADGFSDDAKRIRLLIVGDGPQRDEIKILIHNLGLDSIVIMTGEITHSAVQGYLNQIDICCFPSTLESESFGVSVIEASACEVPVIASNIGGLPEVIIDGETGYLVKPCNEFDLAEKIYLLVINPELRQKMGAQGRRFVIENYDWQENLQRMVNYMEQVVNEYNQEVKKHLKYGK